MPLETRAEVLANRTRCGECDWVMVAVHRHAFCPKPSCSMYGRAVDDQPLPRRLVPQESAS